MNHTTHFFLKISHSLFFVSILLNLAVINFYLLRTNPNSFRSAYTIVSSDTNFVSKNTNSVVCDSDCIGLLYQAIKNATAAGNTKQKTDTVRSFVAKELFVPFGSGENNSTEWENIEGLQVTINRESYSPIHAVTFEATIEIPTGNQRADVRLFNMTQKHPVWFSEISHEGGMAKLLESNQIQLDAGENVYQVQMKTSLQYRALVKNARIRIVLQ